MGPFRGSGRTALVAALLMVIAALPAGANAADAALSLSAWADGSEGRVLETNGHLWVFVHRGANAEVAMPPQVEPVENIRPGGSGTFAGGEAEIRHGSQYHRAAGSLAEGTSEALSTGEDLFVKLAPLGITISAESIRSFSRTTCEEQTAADASAGSAIGSLQVNGETVEVQNTPNGPGQRFESEDGQHYVEVRTLSVEHDVDTNSWTTTALKIRAGNIVPSPVTTPETIPVTHELDFGITSSTVECAA